MDFKVDDQVTLITCSEERCEGVVTMVPDQYGGNVWVTFNKRCGYHGADPENIRLIAVEFVIDLENE